METPIFGVIDNAGVLIDTSKTQLGAKQYATKHGYNRIGFRIGYVAFILSEKIAGKWELKEEPYGAKYERL